MVLKLPILLRDYAVMKKKTIDAIKPLSFISLDGFHKQVLHPGEPLSLYVHELKQLLNQVMPEISAQTTEQLLLHQFLTGLPHEVSKQLRATGKSYIKGSIRASKDSNDC